MVDIEESFRRAMSQIRKKFPYQLLTRYPIYSFDKKNLNRAFNHHGGGGGYKISTKLIIISDIGFAQEDMLWIENRAGIFKKSMWARNR